jgi:heme-degrading monooxygenase HmoA
VVRATLNIKVKEGREAEFEAAWRRIAEQVKAFPGNLRQALARDTEDARSYVITTDWVSRDAFSKFEKSPEQDDLTAPMRELRESGRMVVHDLLVHVEGGEQTDAGPGDGSRKD